jgi:hypothetical protein
MYTAKPPRYNKAWGYKILDAVKYLVPFEREESIVLLKVFEMVAYSFSTYSIVLL